VWSKPVGGDEQLLEQGKQGELKFVPTTYVMTTPDALMLM